MEIIHIILIIIAFLIVWIAGCYLMYKCLAIRNNYHSLSKHEWDEEMDLLPLQEEGVQLKKSSKSQKEKPSNTTMDNASFFNRVQEVRSKRSPQYRCTQKSVQP